MKYKECSYCGTVSEDEDDAEQMPTQLLFDWNRGAVASFVNKLSGVNRAGIDFPQFFGPFQPSAQGIKNFQFELLRMLTRSSSDLEVHGEYDAIIVVAKDPSSLFKLLGRLVRLSNEPWVLAVLQHGEPLPGKLVKVFLQMHSKPQDLIDFEDPLIH